MQCRRFLISDLGARSSDRIPEPWGDEDPKPDGIETFQTPAPFLLTTCLAGGAPPPPRPTAPGLGPSGSLAAPAPARPHRACSLLQRGRQPPFIPRAVAAPSSRPLPEGRASRLCLRHHATPLLEPGKMAAAVLSGPSAGSPAGAPGGAGGLSTVGSGPRLRLLLLESVSGLLQPRTGSPVAPVHPPIHWAPHLPGLMCLLRLHGTVGGAQVSLPLARSAWGGWRGRHDCFHPLLKLQS